MSPRASQQTATSLPRVLIVAEHASLRFGGEAALPLHYYRVLRRKGADVWLISHARCKTELNSLFPEDPNIRLIEDTPLVVTLYKAGKLIPDRLASISTGYLMRLSTQLAARRIAKRLIADHAIDVVHQPIPVSPREPSLIYGLAAPVIIGPMNGAMSYPPAFRTMEGRFTRATVNIGRWASSMLNWLMPGKHRAAALLVANERTRRALPTTRTPVHMLVENGVDLELWQPPATAPNLAKHTRYIFMGRLIKLKAVDLLLEAFKRAAAAAPMTLTIVGDGPERARLEATAAGLGLLGPRLDAPGCVTFTGWKAQHECPALLAASDALVMPSLHECGGAVVLEAMATGRPVIATNWGGPADYIDAETGILIDPATREGLIRGFEQALVTLARNPEQRKRLGARAQEVVRERFDWDRKVDAIVGVYRAAMQSALK